VKVKSFRAPRLFVCAVAQARTILRGCGAVILKAKASTLIIFLSAIMLAVLIWPHDRALLGRLHLWQGDDDRLPHQIAWYLGTYGDYLTYNVPLALLIWIYGVVTKSSAWRRVALIAFLGATLAGGFDDLFRLTLGRARPDAHLADKFYGPAYALSGGFQSFPSGHAASTFGTAAALLLTELPLGLVTTLIACGVVWARMELSRHYPSDVVVGSIIGLYFGLVVGYGARFRRTPSAPCTSPSS
jgi:membrane-associated phospholipid phosphatase